MKMTRGKTLFKLKGDESNNPAESIKKKRAVSAVTPKTPSNKKRPKIKSKPFVSFSTKKVDKSIRRNVFRSGGATPTKITPYKKRAEGFSAKAELNKINFKVDSGSGWKFHGHINGKVKNQSIVVGSVGLYSKLKCVSKAGIFVHVYHKYY